ncbi:MAG: KR domain-containing protein, partial [Planctomycetota bacterium]
MRAFSICVAQEHPTSACRLIDVDANSAPATTARLLWRELQDDGCRTTVALRGSTRWELAYETIRLPKEETLQSISSHLVVGDMTSELARSWARSILTRANEKLTIINTNADCQDELKTFADAGAEVSLAPVDALDETLSQVGGRLGGTVGLYVCGPTANERSASPLALLSEDHWNYNYQTKIAVTESIAAWLDRVGLRPSFVCVQSSMSTVLGGIGLAAYAAANDRLNTFVAMRNRAGGPPWYAVNWDRVRTADENRDLPASTPTFDKQALSPDEVWKATQRILHGHAPGQYVVSRTPLNPRVEKYAVNRPEVDLAGKTDPASSRVRPDLDIDYAAPQTETERQVVLIWEEKLGIQGIGVHDDFFALGGHSLLA